MAIDYDCVELSMDFAGVVCGKCTICGQWLDEPAGETLGHLVDTAENHKCPEGV